MVRLIIASQFSKNSRCAPDPWYQRQQHGSDVGNDGHESSDEEGYEGHAGIEGDENDEVDDSSCS